MDSTDEPRAEDNEISSDELDALLASARFESPESDSRYRIALERRRGVLCLMIQGKVLSATPEEFIRKVEHILLQAEHQGILIDLSQCDYLSSTALGYLVRFFDTCFNTKSQIVLLNPKPKTLNVIRLLGLDNLFLAVESEEMAMAFFQEQGLL